MKRGKTKGQKSSACYEIFFEEIVIMKIDKMSECTLAGPAGLRDGKEVC